MDHLLCIVNASRYKLLGQRLSTWSLHFLFTDTVGVQTNYVGHRLLLYENFNICLSAFHFHIII